MITVEVLPKCETWLRAKAWGGATISVLADYFDFVTGTSTGAIIAACISIVHEVSDIRTFYIESGKEMFDKHPCLNDFATNSRTINSRLKMREVFGKDVRPWHATG